MQAKLQSKITLFLIKPIYELSETMDIRGPKWALKKKIAVRKHATPLEAKPPLSLNPRNAPDVDQCKVCHDMHTWHEILGHCNYEDVKRLQGVVKGMEIKGGAVGLDQSCDVCTQGKFTQTRNREPDRKAKKPLELVHTDLAGPMRTPSIEGHRYAQSFTDDYSGTMLVYFLKSKSDTVQATERFLADIP